MRTTDRYAALNRRARHDYLIEDKLEAGLVLHGTEVKVLRQGGASIVEAYADGGFGGAACTFTADTAWVGAGCNDMMSSFRIR